MWANWRPTASDFSIAWAGPPPLLSVSSLLPSISVAVCQSGGGTMCSTLQVCLSLQIKENCNNNRTWRLFFSFSGSTFCREDDDDDGDDGGSGLLPCGSCSPANGTSCDCGCDFIMQIDSCCGFSTKPPLSTRRSASLSLLFLSLSLWLALSPCLSSPPLSWIIAQSSSVCCPRFGPRFARLSAFFPALPLWSSLAGFVASSLCWQLFSAKFGQQRKKVFTLQRTLVPYGAGRREKEVERERGETECTLRQISCKKMWWFLNEKYLLILKEKGGKSVNIFRYFLCQFIS